MSLEKMAVNGVKWTGYSTIASTALQFLQLAILANLLSPQDFGLMAMVMVVLGFAQAYADMGVSNAIIHHQDTTKEQLSSLYWLNIFAGIVTFVAVFFLATLIAKFYAEEKLVDLIQLTALTFLIIPLGQQFQILLQKEMAFKPLATIEISAVILGTIVAIFSAYQHQGVFSIIWGQLTNSSIKSLFLIYMGWKRWKPILHFRTSDLKGYLSFGLYQMGETSINYLNSRLDQILIGAFIGTQALGYYSLAFNLVIQPISKISPIITRVAFPAFSKIQNQQEKLKKGYLTILSVISLINFPILMGLAVTAPLLIPLVFGEPWSDTIILIQILSFVALLRSQGNPVGSLLLAKGRADLGFKWNAFLMISQVPGVIIGLNLGGVTGVAWSLLILQMIYLVLNFIFLVKLLINPSVKEYVKSLLPAFLYSLIMMISIYLLPSLITLPPAYMLTIQILLGATIYTLLNFMFNKNILKDLGLQTRGNPPKIRSQKQYG